MVKKITGLCICALLNGCMFIGLNEDVKQLDVAVSISGKIENAGETAHPLIVTLSRLENGEISLQAYTVAYGASDFFLSVPAGNYYLLAFEDINQDFTLQENERVGWHGTPSLIEAVPGLAYTEMMIELRDPDRVKKELPVLFVPGKSHEPVNGMQAKPGKVVDISVFKPELGPLGMWSPVKFHREGHSGIYFLEPYAESKIPVIFVHGISGSGHDWLYLIEQLDRERFQPWIVQYPSGMRLDLISRFLSQSVNELRSEFGFERLAVVAHSMGGLVARGFINHQSASGGNDIPIKTLVTISTPWLGHSALKRGPDFAPVAVPSWFDIVPGSPFLRALHQQPIPEETRYYLMFGHKAEGAGLFKRASSDGTVTLRSQLSMEAQAEAIKITGFDEDHVSILKSAHVSEQLNWLLTDSSY